MISLSRALSFSSWQLCMAVVVGEMCSVALPPSWGEKMINIEVNAHTHTHARTHTHTHTHTYTHTHSNLKPNQYPLNDKRKRRERGGEFKD